MRDLLESLDRIAEGVKLHNDHIKDMIDVIEFIFEEVRLPEKEISKLELLHKKNSKMALN